jgi:hypothetical protein
MSTHPFLKATTEGPLGFPLTDRQAIALDAILKALPKDDAFKYRKTVLARGASEVLTGERSDVSWISTEDPDRMQDVVLAKGMNDGQFKQNPIVTMQHDYHLPPVGKSLWRKAASDGATRGIKAKTVYPARPNDWPQEKDWPADIAFALVQADLLRGKSIGFLPTKVHRPTKEEKSLNNWHDVEQVIDEWLLLEYSVTFLPTQQNAVVEAVSKSQIKMPDEMLKALGIDVAAFHNDLAAKSDVPPPAPLTLSRFTPLEEIESAVLRRIARVDLKHIAEKAAQDTLARLQGRV